MSYDLYFLTRQPGQTWEDVMSQLEGDDSENVPLDDETVATWDRVKAAVGPVLPDASELAVPTSRQLNDDATGVQISMFPGELSLTVPYWHTEPDAERIVGILHEVAAAIEQVTGLTAYDPQADAPFLGGAEYGAARTLDDIHTSAIHRHAASEPAADRAPRSERSRALWARLFGRGPR